MKDTLDSYLARFSRVHDVTDLSLEPAFGAFRLCNKSGSRNISGKRYSQKDMRIFLSGFEAGIEAGRAAIPAPDE